MAKSASVRRAAVLFFSMAVLSAASASAIDLGDAKALLMPGSVVEVTWDASLLPSGTEELELLIRLDSGLKLRLTKSLDPTLERVSWRVPALSFGRGRLVLRYGSAGREHDFPGGPEIEVLPSRFVGVSPIVERQGELWLIATDAPIAPGIALESEAPAAAEPHPAESDPQPTVASAYADLGEWAAVLPSQPAPIQTPFQSNAPLVVPLRV